MCIHSITPMDQVTNGSKEMENTLRNMNPSGDFHCKHVVAKLSQDAETLEIHNLYAFATRSLFFHVQIHDKVSKADRDTRSCKFPRGFVSYSSSIETYFRRHNTAFGQLTMHIRIDLNNTKFETSLPVQGSACHGLDVRQLPTNHPFEPPHLYFAYGSNLSPTQMQQRCRFNR